MRNRIAVLAAMMVLPLTGVATLATAGSAGADPQSGKVQVTGNVGDCKNGNSPIRVSITAGQEKKSDKRATVEDSNEYAVNFQKIKASGQAAVATVTCVGSEYTHKFTINRPPTASTIQEEDLEPA
ncbi:hypothetical protein ACWGA9_13365 [Streptomyces sp. NPDC054950]|uniref:hypothetical protein n=1 Tax=Streptomyces sp. NPDC002884 TaxID=3154544 RepID=UPI003318EADD